MCKSVEGVNGAVGKTLDWVRWFSAVAVVPVLALGLIWFARIEDRINTVERDALISQLEMWRSIALKANSADVPPVEVREDLLEIKAAILRIERKHDLHLATHE